jgi:hypothetical protein
MNIALGAVILLLLVSPGYFFLSALHSGNYSRLNFSTSITNQIFISLIPNLIIHALGLKVTSLLYPADLEILYKLMSGVKELNANDFTIISASLLPFSFYVIATNIIGAILGKLTKEGILKNGLDMKFEALRIHNEWYYLLYGKVLDFEGPNRSEEIDYIQIDALVQVGDKKIIYKGFLDRFYLDNDKGLDRIVLYFVYRRFLESDSYGLRSEKEDLFNYNKETKQRYYEMPGDYLVIPYNKIINMNISYKEITIDDAHLKGSEELDKLDWSKIANKIKVNK